MTQLSDDNRFQNLPPEEVRQQIRKSMEAKGLKYVFIDQIEWHNATTRCKHTISNIPIFATAAISERPRIVTEITVRHLDKSTSEHYVYNIDYVHINISNKASSGHSYSSNSGVYQLRDCDDKNTVYEIEYEAICNPITMHHLYSMDQHAVTMLFKGQLMGQNKGSAFRGIGSVAGTYIDKIIKTTNGLFIKRSAPILQLLSRQSLTTLQDKTQLRAILQNTIFPKEDKIAYKLISKDHYIIESKEQYEKDLDNKQVSAYYPVITAEMCEELVNNIPKIDVDFGCFGLGSAGTGVLDMLSRSVFFDKYMLIDFDTVEEKNLRNQWYQRNNIGNSKVQSSDKLLKNRRQNSQYITTIAKSCKFQDIDFNIYKFKYVMAAFDSIETRLEFLDTITKEKSEAKYLIDTRYDELNASIFFIDLEKPEEIEFYRKGLLSDKEAFDRQKEKLRVQSEDMFIQWLEQQECFQFNCNITKEKLIRLTHPNLYSSTQVADTVIRVVDTVVQELPCPRPNDDISVSCQENVDCRENFKQFYRKYKEQCDTLFLSEGESSCVRQNFIDIYHYASTYIYDTIRIIEDEKEKPFTQVDVTTEPLPNAMILRR